MATLASFGDSKVLEVQSILRTTFASVDTSIVNYCAQVLYDSISEGGVYNADDVYNTLYESIALYEMADSDESAFEQCSSVFDSLVATATIKDPADLRKEIMDQLTVGDTVLAQFSEDGQWYAAVVSALKTGGVHVTYTDYANSEWLDPLCVQCLEESSGRLMGGATMQGVKLGEREITTDVSDKINSLMYKTSRFLTDTTKDDKQLSAYGLTSRQKKKLRAELKEKEKVARFDPMRYMKSMRQKARPEWFDLTARKGTRNVRLDNLTMYSLDDSKLLLDSSKLHLETGRKYGLVGLNGCGKTTLLRRISRYDIKDFPAHVRVLHVEQEIHGDDTTILDYVIGCDPVRNELLERIERLDKDKDVLEAEDKEYADEMSGVEAEIRAAAASRSGVDDDSKADEEKKETIMDDSTLFGDVDAADDDDSASDGAADDGSAQQRTVEEQRSDTMARLRRRRQKVERQLIKINDKINDAHELMQELDVVDVEHRAKKVLSGLGFGLDMFSWPTKRLSGGWRMRVSLAGAIHVNPEVLMLDEPTNHLDFPSVVWLQNYLKNEFRNTLLVVSHDREFLNAVVDRILHFDKMQIVEYPGNFHSFVKTKEMEYTGALKKWESQQEEIKKQKSFIDRFRANAKKASMVQSRIKLLANMTRHRKPEKPYSLTFSFPGCEPPIAGAIMTLKNVTFGYVKSMILLNGVSRSVSCLSRIGVVGANGAGKSTMIKLMMEQVIPLRGDVEVNRKARIAVFTQHHMDQLDLSQSPMDYLLEKFADECRAKRRPAEFVRGKLGAFGLSDEDLVSRRMVFLSGGQKTRVALTALTWNAPHFIIMDEPTNHLDVETIDALIEAINSWNGGLLVVSHDQHFLSHVSKVYWSLSIESGTVAEFLDLEEAKAFAARGRHLI